MSLSIPCPRCGAVLRLRDRSALGKTGRCPKCDHRFKLEEPEEVVLELAEPKGASGGPQVGTAAQWVPDAPAAPEAPAMPQAAVFAPSPTDPLARLRRRNKKWTVQQWAIAGAVTVLVGVGGWMGFQSLSRISAPGPQAPAVAPNSASPANAVAENGGDLRDGGETVSTEKNLGRPTEGQPITLHWIPSGARVIINMHPARMWKAGGLGEGEFVACLGPLKGWLESSLSELCLFKVEELEQVLVCLIPGARGTPPDVAAVVTLAKGAKKSDLLEKFGGERKDDAGRPYYVNETRAYAFVSAEENLVKSFALCSPFMAAEMISGMESGNPTDSGIEGLLPQTDADLDLTIITTPKDLRIHGEMLVPANVQQLLQTSTDWVANDDEVEAVAWSLHVSDERHFFTQLLARPISIAKPHQIQVAFEKRLEDTPWRILENVQMMAPQQLGQRKLIGRLPKMSEVVAQHTAVDTGNRLVALTYSGAERAGPNLALASLLAWDESTRTDFNKARPTSPGSSGDSVPDKLVDRFKTKIDVDFRRTPLEDAFKYIAEEAKFDIFVDGNALKLASITKNEPQTLKADQITASDALLRILNADANAGAKMTDKYKVVCALVDEEKKLVTITTLPAAEALGKKPYQLKP